MNLKARRVWPVVMVVVAGMALVGASAVTAVGLSAAVRLVPQATIATVNLEDAVRQLDERAAKEGELKAYSEGLQGELDKLVKQINDEQAKLSALDGDQKREVATKIIELQANARVRKEVYEAMIDQRRAEIFRGLYDKITAASTQLAERGGYSMVIASDEGVKVPPNAPSAEVERTISLRRFLYVSKSHDVTAELVTLMNNEFKAGK